jgi:hypothetical protein
LSAGNVQRTVAIAPAAVLWTLLPRLAAHRRNPNVAVLGMTAFNTN